MRITSVAFIAFIFAACHRDNPDEVAPASDGGVDLTQSSSPPADAPDLAQPPAPLALPGGTWKVGTTGQLGDTCGFNPQEKRGTDSWTTIAVSADEVRLFTGGHAMVTLRRTAPAIYEGEVAELVSPFSQCTIRDRLGYFMRLVDASEVDVVLTQRFELAAGDCTGVLPLPCQVVDRFTMMLAP
jgi:hypothetical protein